MGRKRANDRNDYMSSLFSSCSGSGRGSGEGSEFQTLSWTDWIDSCGIDFFGCDENCSSVGARNVLADALRLRSNTIVDVDVQPVNYASLHDEVLESLLYEQTKASKEEQQNEDHRDDDEESSSVPSQMMSMSSAVECESLNGSERSSTSSRKRLRPIRLQRKGSPSPLLDSNRSTSTVQLEELSAQAGNFQKDPGFYFHSQCRMQKDKGKGEEIGSNICAKGREACLDKLRAKMRVLTDVVLDPNKGPATMKRRKARIAEEYENFTETRSLIELKMGFLSMTYGVLLRWDSGRTGKVTLVVLRKMCHDSFYPRRTNSIRSTSSVSHRLDVSSNSWMSSMSSSSTQHQKPLPQLRDVVDSHAILQRHDGTEVTLLEPPYHVPRPVTFEPSILSASVLFATGLSKRSNWTVKLSYEGHSESLLLTWDTAERCFVPKLGQPLNRTVASLNISSPLELKLYEHRLRRRSYRRLITTMQVPLHNLEPQSSSSKKPVRLMIPCKHDQEATISLGLLFCSDYGHWVNQELDTRQREEVKNFMWMTPFRMSSSDVLVTEDEDADGSWDWICSVC